MAQFSVDINDEMVETVFDSFAERFDYARRRLDENETKQAFTRRVVIGWIKEQVGIAQADIAAAAARTAKEAELATSLVIE